MPTVVLARFVAATKTAALQTNVVYLTSVLIVAVQDVPQIQTAVQDNTVVRKDIGMNSVSAVITVLENLVMQTTIVADLTRLVSPTSVVKQVNHSHSDLVVKYLYQRKNPRILSHLGGLLLLQ